MSFAPRTKLYTVWYDYQRVAFVHNESVLTWNVEAFGIMVDLQQVINSSLSLRLVSALAQKLPPSLGYRVADFMAEQIARQRNSTVVRAVRLNQWIVNGEKFRGDDLDQVVHQTFRYWAHCVFDLYHYIHDPGAAGQRIVLDSSAEQLARRSKFDDHGLMIVGIHLSNFDLVLQWFCKHRLKPLVLTIPNPEGGRRLEYDLRQKSGMNLLPVSVGALKQAVKHLQRGGMVVTGIDRPIPSPEARPRFFERPAALPMHHIFLAARAGVPIVVAAPRLQEDGKYHVMVSEPIEIDHYPDSKVRTLRNAEKVLRVAEGVIRKAPQQWSVPLPVWPQMMEFVPK